jgi:hypothetical protein
MSITAGVFSETALVDIQVKIDQIWADAIQKQDYVANVDAVTAILSNQTAFISELKGNKDRTVDIGWINACEIADEACQICTIDGEELSTNVEEKTLATCREAHFKVEEGVFRSNLFDAEEVIAKGFLAAMKELDEFWAATLVAFLNANLGVNAVTNGKGVVNGTGTYILPAFWDAGLMSYFNRASKVNQFVNPFLLSGANLYESVWNAAYERSQAGAESKILKFGSMPIYFDLFNIDSVNDPDLLTYMIHKGSVAFVAKNYYPSTVTRYMDEHRWSMPSKNIPGLVYDVHYKDSCEAQGSYDAMTFQYKLRTFGDFFLNPTGCDDTRTGILGFYCGEEPE